MVLYSVLTETKANHPWAKYYEERGIARPGVSTLPRRAAARRSPASATAAAASRKQPEISAELAAAVAAVTTANPASAAVSTATPFITARQKEMAVREAKHSRRLRYAKRALATVAALVGIHFAVTRLLYRAPADEALHAHVQSLPEAVLPLFSSARQPLQADGVVIAQADQIDSAHFRYVAVVTLRLRKPLYVPAVTNGTASYRRLQEALQHARDQELRFKLFDETEAPKPPTLPLLLQRVHQAGETILVRVPFTARRYGWQWRIDAPQLALQTASRLLQGDSLDRYASTPHLIFGVPATLAEIRVRTKAASNYVLAVAKEVQRHSNGAAVADPVARRPALADAPAQPALADLPAQEASALADLAARPAEAAAAVQVAARPAIDPDAPAVFMAPPARFFSPPPRTTAR